MAKRYEIRIDSDEYRAWQDRAREDGATSVAEWLRKLARDRERGIVDETLVDALSRSSLPKVT